MQLGKQAAAATAGLVLHARLVTASRVVGLESVGVEAPTTADVLSGRLPWDMPPSTRSLLAIVRSHNHIERRKEQRAHSLADLAAMATFLQGEVDQLADSRRLLAQLANPAEGAAGLWPGGISPWRHSRGVSHEAYLPSAHASPRAWYGALAVLARAGRGLAAEAAAVAAAASQTGAVWADLQRQCATGASEQAVPQ